MSELAALIIVAGVVLLFACVGALARLQWQLSDRAREWRADLAKPKSKHGLNGTDSPE